jgi:hypothetical protein
VPLADFYKLPMTPFSLPSGLQLRSTSVDRRVGEVSEKSC